jgi:hypothetical protein
MSYQKNDNGTVTELSSEELLRRLTAEMVRLHDSGAGMRLEIAPETALAVVAYVQLALRHPQANLGPSARLVEQFIEYVRAKFEPHAPAITEAIRRGNEPEYDTPREPYEPSGPAWPPDPPELQGLNQEQRRFYRLIEEREANDDGSQKITLACGHESIQVIPIPDDVNYMQCAHCVNAWVEAERQDRK